MFDFINYFNVLLRVLMSLFSFKQIFLLCKKDVCMEQRDSNNLGYIVGFIKKDTFKFKLKFFIFFIKLKIIKFLLRNTDSIIALKFVNE